jgi:hypothetical protein
MPREALVSRNENPYDLGGSNIEWGIEKHHITFVSTYIVHMLNSRIDSGLFCT